MSKSIVNQEAPGAAVKRSCDSDTATMLGKTGNTIINQAQGAAVKRSRVIGQSEYPDFVFTSLTDAIREWEETGTSNALDLSFNIIATVQQWSLPKQSKGVNSSNIFAQETNMWFKGSDLHVTATLLSNEQDRRIYASFFFDRSKDPKSFSVGEKVRLLGTRLRRWNGEMQLTGKNIQFGQSCVFMSLTDAIGAWEHVKRVQPLLFLIRPPPRAEHHFPSLTMIVAVKKWGDPKWTQGEKLHVFALMLYYILKRVVRSPRY
jgi:hypothetical protein